MVHTHCMHTSIKAAQGVYIVGNKGFLRRLGGGQGRHGSELIFCDSLHEEQTNSCFCHNITISQHQIHPLFLACLIATFVCPFLYVPYTYLCHIYIFSVICMNRDLPIVCFWERKYTQFIDCVYTHVVGL